MEVLYSDDDLIVINKPAGLAVLPDGWQTDLPYLVKLLEPEYGRIFVVHRLDKMTSGVIVFARNPDSHRALDLQFQRREVKKNYHAIANGIPGWKEHTAKFPLRVNVGHRHRTIVDSHDGKPSETHFVVMRRFLSEVLLLAEPRTGRTHQIRVHAFALGYPLLSDTLYGAPPSQVILRPALHALSLAFRHPSNGKLMTFEATYPDDFATALGVMQERMGQ